MSQFDLLKQRRFGPFFATQFLGAFYDNLFKNALVVLSTFGLVGQSQTDSHTLVNLAAGLFILPFFLFSATAGQLADKYDKSWLMRRIKLAEVGIMLVASVGFLFGNAEFLIVVLFLMGTQSTFFGPVKYAILPQHLKEQELVGGNGRDGDILSYSARHHLRSSRSILGQPRRCNGFDPSCAPGLGLQPNNTARTTASPYPLNQLECFLRNHHSY